MLRQLALRISREIKPVQVCGFCARTHATTESAKWKIATAVCLERYPVITQELNDLEKKYKAMIETVEVENSLLSEHEEQVRLDKIMAQMKKERDERGDEEEEEAVSKEKSTKTALDLEDEWDKEFKEYTIPSRITEADEKNDMKSTRRKLDRKLVLIVQKNLNGKPTWILPQGFYNNEESLKETALNVLSQYCGDKSKTKIFGNAPNGFYQYKLPKSETDADGVKLFIYRAEFKEGKLDISDKDISDYKWVTLDELSEFVKPQYEKTIKQFVIEI